MSKGVVSAPLTQNPNQKEQSVMRTPPEGMPIIAVMMLAGEKAYCSHCFAEVPMEARMHAESDCGARFVAIGSLLGVADSRLRHRDDLTKVNLYTRRSVSDQVWATRQEAINFAIATDGYFVPTAQHAFSHIRRNYSRFLTGQTRGPAPYEVRLSSEETGQEFAVELKGLLRYLEDKNPAGIGVRSRAFLEDLLRHKLRS